MPRCSFLLLPSRSVSPVSSPSDHSLYLALSLTLSSARPIRSCCLLLSPFVLVLSLHPLTRSLARSRWVVSLLLPTLPYSRETCTRSTVFGALTTTTTTTGEPKANLYALIHYGALERAFTHSSCSASTQGNMRGRPTGNCERARSLYVSRAGKGKRKRAAAYVRPTLSAFDLSCRRMLVTSKGRANERQFRQTSTATRVK